MLRTRRPGIPESCEPAHSVTLAQEYNAHPLPGARSHNNEDNP
jgi:hypothetical protein